MKFRGAKVCRECYYLNHAQLVKCGFRLENQPRGDFEIKGVASELIDKFSKRHGEIDRQTKECWRANPKRRATTLPAIRENIAHKERPRKIRDIGWKAANAVGRSNDGGRKRLRWTG